MKLINKILRPLQISITRRLKICGIFSGIPLESSCTHDAPWLGIDSAAYGDFSDGVKYVSSSYSDSYPQFGNYLDCFHKREGMIQKDEEDYKTKSLNLGFSI